LPPNYQRQGWAEQKTCQKSDAAVARRTLRDFDHELKIWRSIRPLERA
jgi:hypothetical protein